MSIINAAQATIDTVVPTVNLGEIMLSADRRGTKEKPLSDAERIRRAVLPANHWQELAATQNGARSVGLTDLLRNALRDIANARLRDYITETADSARTINLSDYTVTALLSWHGESAATRGSITFTREQVLDWLERSATATAMLAKHGPVKGAAVIAFLTKRLGALAARNHGLREESDALKLVAAIDPADTNGPDSALVSELLQRLDHISKQLRARADDASISMDDL